MTNEEIIRMAHEAGLHIATDHDWMPIIALAYAKKFAEVARAAEREKVARWQIGSGYATGHGETIEDLLVELEWQVRESEREACAKVCEEAHWSLDDRNEYAAAIRARGQG